MKKLNRESFERVAKSLMEEARPLEQKLFMHEFYNGTKEDILVEILKYQNEDGGFGKGLECDIRMPDSSPKATSIGVRVLSKLDTIDEAKEAIKKAVNYLEASFDIERGRWFIGSSKINDYPHGPWWHFNVAEGLTQLDLDWGNPNAEIIAYLHKYRQLVKKLDVDKLIISAVQQLESKKVFLNDYRGFVQSIRTINPPEYVLSYFNNTRAFDPRGEILCYIKLYSLLDGELKTRLENKIEAAISEIIVYDEEIWENDYAPMPLDFVPAPGTNSFGVDNSQIERNLDLFISFLEKEGKIDLKWARGKDYYEDERKPAYKEWVWIFTMAALRALKNYGKIDGYK